MDAKDFSSLADLLYQDQSFHSESGYRTMIGRWYYAVYNDVNSWLKTRFENEFNNAVGATHQKLTYCCNDLQQKNFDLAFSRLGRLIAEMKNHRVQADYFLDVKLRKFDAEQTKLKIEEIYMQLNQLKSKYP